MNLINEKWITVISFSGEKSRISLFDLLNDDINDLDYPRADFQGAAYQMMIGILQSVAAPEDHVEWDEIWNEGIDPEKWKQGLQFISPAFQFGSEKPSFLQSFDSLQNEKKSAISGLLIDAPGDNTLKLNKDHFVKRDHVQKICPYCCAIALFTMQTNSPSGGSGYRVSMRGGGPLTTLVVPQQDSHTIPLWKKLWLNVLPKKSDLNSSDLPHVFPWLAPTKTSEKDKNIVTPENAHWLQAYWGMPRRIEIDFDHTAIGHCDLCGERSNALLLDIRTKNYGIKYENWIHPLSPHRFEEKNSPPSWTALKGKPGGFGYKDWVSILFERTESSQSQPAQIVKVASNYSYKNTALWCFAWDMDNAKARCWYQHRIPFVKVRRSDVLIAVLDRIILLAAKSLGLLKNALKNAMFAVPKQAKIDFSTIEIAFWQETEVFFNKLLSVLVNDPRRTENSTNRAIKHWEKRLGIYIITVFDKTILTNPNSPSEILLRQLEARNGLIKDYHKQKERNDLLKLAKTN